MLPLPGNRASRAADAGGCILNGRGLWEGWEVGALQAESPTQRAPGGRCC